MIQILKRAPALVLLIGGIVLLQTHAMDYWSRYDAATGWLWSLVIEGAAIWLWAARNWVKNSIALFATLLALAAPLYQLAAPVLEGQRAGEQSASTLPTRIVNKEAEIQQLEADLATYNRNSENRGGWLEIIATTKTDLKSARTELEAMQAEQSPAEWQGWLQVATHGLALIIIQCLVVLTTRTLFAPLPVGGDLSPKQEQQHPAGASEDQGRPRNAQLKTVKPKANGKRLTPAAA